MIYNYILFNQVFEQGSIVYMFNRMLAVGVTLKLIK